MTLSSRLCLILAFSFGLTGCPQDQRKPLPSGPQNAPQAILAQSSPLCVSRTRLAPEPDRDSLLAWTRDGALDLTYKLGTKLGTMAALSQTEEFYETGYHGLVTLPAGTAPGAYTLDCGSGHTASVDVVAIPDRGRPVTIPADSDSRANVLKAVKAGKLDLILAPGLHVWPEMVILPEWVRITGYGAVVTHGYLTNYGTNWPLIYLSRNVSVYGVTFQHRQADHQVFIYLGSDANSPTGLVVADCVFRRCNFGFFLRDAFVRDCRFESAGATIAPGGCWLRNKFLGPPLTHALSYWSNCGPFACVDNTLEGTDRGIVFNTTWGPQTGHLLLGTRHRNIRRTSSNAGECHTFEGPGPFDNHLFLHDDFASCSGPLYQWGGNMDGTARHNLIMDVRADEGLGVIWWGADVSGNELREFKFRGTGVYLGPGAKNNTLSAGRIIGWLPDSGNQPASHPSSLCTSRTCAILAEGPDAGTNVLTDVQVLGLHPDFTAVRGIPRRP